MSTILVLKPNLKKDLSYDIIFKKNYQLLVALIARTQP
jgi:hypothetical protein